MHSLTSSINTTITTNHIYWVINNRRNPFHSFYPSNLLLPFYLIKLMVDILYLQFHAVNWKCEWESRKRERESMSIGEKREISREGGAWRREKRERFTIKVCIIDKQVSSPMLQGVAKSVSTDVSTHEARSISKNNRDWLTNQLKPKREKKQERKRETKISSNSTKFEIYFKRGLTRV